MYIVKSTLIFIAAFLIIGCSKSSSDNTGKAPSDSLDQYIEKTIAQKKELMKRRQKFEESRAFRSIIKYKPIIKKYSKRYGFDWRLIAAQIMQESRFRESARSRAGARGLMQIMPGTARELSAELDIIYILKNPRENIAAGIYHMKKQFNYFPKADFSNRIKLSLAAYNAGVGRVFDAQDISVYYHRSPYKWINIKKHITMLKKEDWAVHLQVWPQGKPRYGYFKGYNETIPYVDNIWDMYQYYKLLL